MEQIVPIVNHIKDDQYGEHGSQKKEENPEDGLLEEHILQHELEQKSSLNECVEQIADEDFQSKVS